MRYKQRKFVDGQDQVINPSLLQAFSWLRGFVADYQHFMADRGVNPAHELQVSSFRQLFIDELVSFIETTEHQLPENKPNKLDSTALGPFVRTFTEKAIEHMLACQDPDFAGRLAKNLLADSESDGARVEARLQLWDVPESKINSYSSISTSPQLEVGDKGKQNVADQLRMLESQDVPAKDIDQLREFFGYWSGPIHGSNMHGTLSQDGQFQRRTFGGKKIKALMAIEDALTAIWYFVQAEGCENGSRVDTSLKIATHAFQIAITPLYEELVDEELSKRTPNPETHRHPYALMFVVDNGQVSWYLYSDLNKAVVEISQPSFTKNVEQAVAKAANSSDFTGVVLTPKQGQIRPADVNPIGSWAQALPLCVKIAHSSILNPLARWAAANNFDVKDANSLSTAPKVSVGLQSGASFKTLLNPQPVVDSGVSRTA